jgi:hypothetical protein
MAQISVVLPAPLGSEQRAQLPFAERQRRPVERNDVAELLPGARDGQDVCRSRHVEERMRGVARRRLPVNGGGRAVDGGASLGKMRENGHRCDRRSLWGSPSCACWLQSD